MLKPAFGMITFLLGLLIVAIMFAIMVPTLKSTSGGALGPSSIQTESAEDKANEKIKDIQKMKQEAQNYYNNSEY